jgi:hypothetical protein
MHREDETVVTRFAGDIGRGQDEYLEGSTVQRLFP